MQGIHTPLGSAFNPAVYLYCLLTENKESFSPLSLSLFEFLSVFVFVFIVFMGACFRFDPGSSLAVVIQWPIV